MTTRTYTFNPISQPLFNCCHQQFGMLGTTISIHAPSKYLFQAKPRNSKSPDIKVNVSSAILTSTKQTVNQQGVTKNGDKLSIRHQKSKEFLTKNQISSPKYEALSKRLKKESLYHRKPEEQIVSGEVLYNSQGRVTSDLYGPQHAMISKKEKRSNPQSETLIRQENRNNQGYAAMQDCPRNPKTVVSPILNNKSGENISFKINGNHASQNNNTNAIHNFFLNKKFENTKNPSMSTLNINLEGRQQYLKHNRQKEASFQYLDQKFGEKFGINPYFKKDIDSYCSKNDREVTKAKLNHIQSRKHIASDSQNDIRGAQTDKSNNHQLEIFRQNNNLREPSPRLIESKIEREQIGECNTETVCKGHQIVFSDKRRMMAPRKSDLEMIKASCISQIDYSPEDAEEKIKQREPQYKIKIKKKPTLIDQHNNSNDRVIPQQMISVNNSTLGPEKSMQSRLGTSKRDYKHNLAGLSSMTVNSFLQSINQSKVNQQIEESVVMQDFFNPENALSNRWEKKQAPSYQGYT